MDYTIRTIKVKAYTSGAGAPTCATNRGTCQFLRVGFGAEEGECLTNKSQVTRGDFGFMRPNDRCPIWNEDPE